MNKKSLKAMLLQNATGKVSDDIMNYVTGHVGEVSYMNLDRFAYATQSTTKELEHFLGTLGFANFLEFKAALRKSHYYEKDGDKLQEMNIRSIAGNMMRCEMQNLTEFFNDFDYDLLDRFVQDITAASEIVLLGMRAAMPYAYYAATMLSRVGIRATRFDIKDCNSVDYISTLNRSALIITFGFPRYHKVTVAMASTMKNQGFHVVSITDSPRSPMAMLADYSFCLPVHSHDFSDSYTAGMMLINLITFRLGMLDQDGMLQRLNNYEQMCNDMDIFF